MAKNAVVIVGQIFTIIAFLGGVLLSQAKSEERVQAQLSMQAERITSGDATLRALYEATRAERQMQVEGLTKRMEIVEARQHADAEMLREIRSMGSKLTDMDRRITELREDVRRVKTL